MYGWMDVCCAYLYVYTVRVGLLVYRLVNWLRWLLCIVLVSLIIFSIPNDCLLLHKQWLDTKHFLLNFPFTSFSISIFVAHHLPHQFMNTFIHFSSFHHPQLHNASVCQNTRTQTNKQMQHILKLSNSMETIESEPLKLTT